MKSIAVLYFFLLLCCSCYREADYQKPFNESLLQITPSPASIPADGASTASITVQIPYEADDTFSTITLKTSAGVFTETGEKTVTLKPRKNAEGNARIAETLLRSGTTTDTATVSIVFFDQQKTVKVVFTNAYPQTLELTPSTFTIQPSNTAGGEVSLDGLVRKMPGIPSVGNTIDVQGYDSAFSKTLGSFRVYNNRTNDAGKTNYVYVLGDSVANGFYYTGKLYLIGRTRNAQNDFIADTVQLIATK